MDFLREPWMFWTALIVLLAIVFWLFRLMIKYWHNVKWVRWPLVIIASLAVGFFLHDAYDERFGESCPPFVAAPAPIVPPLAEPSLPREANTEDTLQQRDEPPAQ